MLMKVVLAWKRFLALYHHIYLLNQFSPYFDDKFCLLIDDIMSEVYYPLDCVICNINCSFLLFRPSI